MNIDLHLKRAVAEGFITQASADKYARGELTGKPLEEVIRRRQTAKVKNASRGKAVITHNPIR